MPSPVRRENNYPDDPNTALVKMRMFGEATAKHLGLLLDIPLCENQHDLLRELGKISFVDDNILSVFHKLRRIGNQAVHEYHNDLDDAQMCLRLGFRLAVWYYRLVTKDYDFPVPVLCCLSTVRIATTPKFSPSNSNWNSRHRKKYKARQNWKLSSND
ncbi:type I restriction-modification system [Klebsiella pneumoniae]|uniref:Type I restriction-modification system n=1 Tax=Klebsiella pneumoniae TaxID=573 RepID=A0A2X3CNL6_KLEPN|nr:type I restriction-modification system [Klebsiella pneumoniae]